MYFFSRRVRLTRNGWKAAPRPATRVLFRCFSSYLHTCMFVILLLSHKHANVCPLEVLQKGPSQTEKQTWHHHRIGSSTGVSVRINSARCVCVCAAQVLAHLHTLCKDGKAVGPANPKKMPSEGTMWLSDRKQGIAAGWLTGFNGFTGLSLHTRLTSPLLFLFLRRCFMLLGHFCLADFIFTASVHFISTI